MLSELADSVDFAALIDVFDFNGGAAAAPQSDLIEGAMAICERLSITVEAESRVEEDNECFLEGEEWSPAPEGLLGSGESSSASPHEE